MSLVWINGQLVDKAEARVSPFDHGFLYGDGVWEPLRVFRGQLFRPDDHIRQLVATAEGLSIDIPLSPTELIAAVRETVRANNRTEGYVRVIATRGPGTIGPDPRKLDPQVLIIAEEYLPFPTELYESGLHAAYYPFLLEPFSKFNRFRVLGQPLVVSAKQYALKYGCLESLFVESTGEVIRATEGELFVVIDGRVHHLSYNWTDLPFAVTSGVVIAAGYTLYGGGPGVSLQDLRAADEVFLAGTSCGVIGIVQIDGQPIGPGTEGPITRRIRLAYRQLTRGE